MTDPLLTRSATRDPRLIVDHCSQCGMGLHDSAEYHPYVFCILKDAGQDPWEVVKQINRDLGLVPDDALPKRPPLVRHLPRRHRRG